MKRFLKSGLSILLAITIIFSSAIVGLGEIDFDSLFAVKADAASMGENCYKIILTWGANPKDLDSHVSGTLADGTAFHCYFGKKNIYYNDSLVVNLDKDDTTSYGPETTTITLEPSVFDGEFTYYIYNFSGTGSIPGAGATVSLYKGDTLLGEYDASGSSTGRYWTLFHVKNGNIYLIDEIGTSVSNNISDSAVIIDNVSGTIRQVSSDYSVLSYSDLKTIDNSIVAYDDSSLKITATDYYSVDISDCTLISSSVMVFGAIPTSTNSHISAVHCNGYDAIVEADNVKFPVSGQVADDEEIININVYTDLEEFSEFQLLQNGAVLQTSTTGSFSLSAKTIPTGDSLSVRVVGSDGKKYSKIKTNIETYEAKTDFSVQGSKISITIPEDIFIVGGAEFDLNLEDLPVFIMRSDDSIKIGIGASETSEYIKNGETENSELWGEWKGLVDKLKNDYTDGMIDAKAYKCMHDLNMGKFFSSTGFVPKGTAKVCAYAEFRYVDGEWTSVGANGCLAVSFTVENEWQTFVWSVPIVLKLEGSVGANADFSVGFDFDEGRWYTEADIDFILPEVRGSIGVGIARVFDGSAYIKLKNNVKVSFKNEYVNCVLNGELGLSGKFLCFSGEKSLWNFMDWQYYYNSWATSSVNMPDYYSNLFSPDSIYDENVYSIDKREHLETQSEWYGAYNFSTFNLRGPIKYTEKLLQESVYEAVNPITVTTSNGITMMVWTADIAERATGNHTALVFSVYDNALDVWSEPQIICDDGTADSYPDVMAYGNNIYVTWVNVNKQFDETVTVEEMSSACEISVACYNSDISTFTKIADLTNDTYFNYLPVITVKDDVLYVAYAENTNNDPFTQKGENSLYVATVNGDGTYTTEKVTTAVNPFTGLDIGFIDNNLNLTYLMDTDSDITTSEDVELFVYDNNKQILQITDNNIAEQSVQFARINGMDYISYYCNDNIYYFNDVSKINSVSTSGNSVFSPEYKFVDDADGTVLISKAISLTDDAANIYASIYSDGSWLTPIKVTNSEIDIKSFDVYNTADTGIGVVYSKAQIDVGELIEEENGKFKGTYKEIVDLYSTSFVRYSDISINNVTVNEESITADGNVSATISVTNNGLIAINSAVLAVQSNEATVCQVEFENLNLLPGETKELNANVLLGTIDNLNTYNFIVDVTETSDVDSTNNEKTVEIGYVDINLSLERSVSNGNTSCVVVIKNNSCISSDLEMVIRKNSYDGEIVQRRKLPAIGAFEEVKYYIIPEIIAGNFSSGDAVCIEIVAAEDEMLLDNNYQFFTISKPEIEIFEYNILENNCIEITKYNGDDDGVVIPKTFDDYTVTGIAATSISANVTQITIPETITNIHPNAFDSATKLQKIIVADNNALYSDVNGVLYSKDKAKLVRLPIAYQGDFVFEENVTTIGECAFNGHILSEEFNVPETITTIEKSAFSKSTGIKYVFYTGTKEEWTKISIDSDNACLTNAYVHYETTEHIYSDEWTVDVAPKCTEVGSKSHKCIFCDCKIDVTEVPATGHNYSTEWTVDLEPTCVKEGSKSHHCANCGGKTDVTVIPAKGHSYSTEWTIDLDATCTKDGSKSHHCAICGGKTDVTVIPAVGHSYSTTWTIDTKATCTEDGSKSHHCTVCDEKTDVTVIAATGHNYKVQSIEATHPHTTAFKCSACSVEKTEDSNCVDCEFILSPINSNSYELISYLGTDSDVVIPSNYNGIPVTAIDSYTFNSSEGVETVTIPDSVLSIDADVFNNPLLKEITVNDNNPNYTSVNGVLYTKDLTTVIRCPMSYQCDVVLPDKVTTISNKAFYQCSYIGNVMLPDGVVSIGNYAFSGCKGLSEFSIPCSVELIGNYAFDNCSFREITIPENVKSVGMCAFRNNTNLKVVNYNAVSAEKMGSGSLGSIELFAFGGDALETLNIGENVQSIPSHSFRGASIDNIFFAENCKLLSIGAYAFSGNGFKSIKIPITVTNIGNYAFDGCRFLKYVFYLGSEIEWGNITIGSNNEPLTNAFIHYSLTEHTFEETVRYPTCTAEGVIHNECTVCGLYTDEAIPMLEHNYSDEWTIDDEPTCIMDGWKSHRCIDCGNRTDITSIPATGHIGRDEVVVREPTCTRTGSKYQLCSVCGFKSIITVPSLGHKYSEDWTIDIPGTCTTSGSKSHHCIVCDSKTDVTVIEATGHNYVTTVEPSHPHTTTQMCSFCEDTITEIPYISDCVECNFTVTAIDENSYKLVSYIGTGENIVIPTEYNGLPVTKIEANCFKGNTIIKNVVIPEGVTSMGNAVFYGCTNLESVTLPSTLTSTGNAAFYNCTSLKSVEIADGVTTIGNSAFRGCTALETITIPSSVTTIGAQAFNGFTGLIYCTKDSAAHNYAVSNSIRYSLIGISETEDTQIDSDNLIIKTTVQNCGDITEILGVSDTAKIVVTASYKQGSVELLGTGTIISVYEGDTLIGDYTLVVSGDTNGDSVCDVLDCADVERAANGNTDLSGAYAMAADSNADEIVDITDYQAIVNKALSS